MSIGEKLKAARKKEKLTLEEVSAQTRVNQNILKHLEEDKFSEILNPTYIKGFLRKYAAFLKLDPEEIVGEYLRSLPPEPKPILKLPGVNFPPDSRSWFFPLTVVVLIILIAALTYHLISPRWLTPVSSVRERTDTVVSGDSEAAAKPVKEEVGVTAVGEVLRLGAKAKGDCWVRIRADGRVIFQDILRAGEKAVWKAGEKFELHVGKAENLDLELNGNALGSPGKGVMKHIVITRQGMRVER